MTRTLCLMLTLLACSSPALAQIPNVHALAICVRSQAILKCADARGNYYALCNDGSISGSKRSCAAYTGSTSTLGNRPFSSALNSTDSSSECSCESSTFCTGPRGGVYCLTPAGHKSYLRK